MLFSCYINDITNVAKDLKIMLYADDTVLYANISDDYRFLDLHDFKQDVNKTKVVFFIHTQTLL